MTLIVQIPLDAGASDGIFEQGGMRRRTRRWCRPTLHLCRTEARAR